MNTHDMEQKLRTAVDHLTPDDGLPEILAACAETTRGEQPIMEYTTSPKRDNRFIKAMSLASAACIMVAGLFWWNRYRALNYVVEMDVNPSIELRVNNAEKVIKAYPLNEDGKEILDDEADRHRCGHCRQRHHWIDAEKRLPFRSGKLHPAQRRKRRL